MARKNKNPDVPASTQDDVLRLHASDMTRQAIGPIADRLPGVAKADLLVFSPEDLPVPTGQSFRTLFNKIAPPDVVHHFNSVLTKKDWQDHADAIHNGASALSMDLNGDGKNDLGIIVTDSLNQTPAQFAANTTGISAEKFTNLPGQKQDYLAATVLHESFHIPQDQKTGTTLSPETGADRGMIQEYKTAIQDGIPLNANVPQTIADLRLGSSLRQYGGMLEKFSCQLRREIESCGTPTHATHIGLAQTHDHEGHNDTGLPEMEKANAAELQDMMIVKSAANIMRGMHYTDNVAQDIGLTGKLPKGADLYFKNPQDVAITSQDYLRLGKIGQHLNAESPIGAKAIVDGLKQSGLFTPSPGALQYIGKLDQFFDRYTPGYKNDPEYQKFDSFNQQLKSIPFFNRMAEPATPAPASAPEPEDQNRIRPSVPASSPS